MIINGIATNPKIKKDNNEPIKNKICILYFAQVNSLIFNENNGTIEVGKNADFILLGENPLEKLETLKEIKGVFYNNHYLNDIQLNEIRNNIGK